MVCIQYFPPCIFMFPPVVDPVTFPSEQAISSPFHLANHPSKLLRRRCSIYRHACRVEYLIKTIFQAPQPQASVIWAWHFPSQKCHLHPAHPSIIQLVSWLLIAYFRKKEKLSFQVAQISKHWSRETSCWLVIDRHFKLPNINRPIILLSLQSVHLVITFSNVDSIDASYRNPPP